MTTWLENHFGLSHNSYLKNDTPFQVGVEYEIESIKSMDNLHKVNYQIVSENDHSLRNNGKEFKTTPLTYEESIECFQQLHKYLVYGKDPFSERTSIHVHVNCRELSAKQLRELILCYALLEPLFFDYVGDTRKHSIFCVPLNHTYLPDYYKKEIQTLVENWHKYTAFNIVPLQNFGTIEFRHLYGTNNVDIFKTWLSAIRDLFMFIYEHPEYSLLDQLLKGTTARELALLICPTLASKKTAFWLQEMLRDTTLDVKLAGGGFYK